MSAHSDARSFGKGPRAASVRALPARTAGSWILGPSRDLLFIVAAPVLVLVLATALFGWQGAARATSLILVTHVVMTVAHHLPTFIRIYGDVELFRRHRWTFLLAPVIPFLGALSALTYLNARGDPVENVLYLFLLLTLWDPWHFLMQHYGFTRLYDRGGNAPPPLAARMDLVLSIGCFVAIMLLCGDWLPDLLEDLYRVAGLPLILALPDALPQALARAGLTLGGVSIAAYAGYLVYCRHKGWRISRIKLALCLSFFAVMYLAYTPNAWIQALAPGWSFKVGFAVVGIVHMTQYLAIVWHYNRNLARRPGRARGGVFARAFARGGLAIALVYTVLCLGYGAVLSGQHASRGWMTLLLALGFTSTLLHYYFDGFIWKLRHRQNQENLQTAGEAVSSSSEGARSWWTHGAARGPGTVLARHALYFGVPMLLLTIGAARVWRAPMTPYTAHMVQAQWLAGQGDAAGAVRAARQALAAMDAQYPLASKLAALQPSASRQAALAFLLHDRARYRQMLLPTLDARPITQAQRHAYAQAVTDAADRLEHALALRGSPAHEGRERMTADDVRRVVSEWRAEARALQPGHA